MKPLRFIHIPKTGGSSVLKFLTDNNINFFYGNEPKRVGRHRYAITWKDEHSIKFTVVRNPYTRTVSYYNYITNNLWRPTFEDFVQYKLINKNYKIPDVWIPQTEWIYHNNICYVDKIFKLEDNFETMLNTFLKTNSKLSKENVSTFNRYDSYYTSKTKEMVKEYFESDFKLLGYEK